MIALSAVQGSLSSLSGPTRCGSFHVLNIDCIGIHDDSCNECTKVQNPRRHYYELDQSVYKTACANSRTRRRYRNLRVTGSIRKTFSQRRRLKTKKLAALLSSRIPGSV